MKQLGGVISISERTQKEKNSVMNQTKISPVKIKRKFQNPKR